MQCVWKDNRSEIVTNCNNEEQEGNETGGNKTNEKNQQRRIRSKVDRIKVKGLVEEEKWDGVVRLFSVNYNGLGPRAVGKIDQTLDSSKRMKIDGLMISSSEVRWTEHNKNKMTCNLKNINKMLY